MAHARVVVLALAVAGCGSARILARDDRGGSLVLEGFRLDAIRDAHDKMTARCGGGPYTIVREGDRPAAGGPTEYVVEYVCGTLAGRPHSQYAPPDTTVPAVPNASPIGLD